MRKRYSRFHKTVSRIILLTFIWTIFSPGFALASSKTGDGSKTPPRHPRMTFSTGKPQMLIDLEKKAKEKEKAAAKKLSASDKKSDRPKFVWKLKLVKEDGTVEEINSDSNNKVTEKSQAIETRQTPLQAYSTSQNPQGYSSQQSPTNYPFYREVLSPDDDTWYYFDATPPGLKTYKAMGGPSYYDSEDVFWEYLWFFKRVTPGNPTGQGNYLISINWKLKAPLESRNTYNDGTDDYEKVSKSVYSSWYDSQGKKYYQLRLYTNGQVWHDTGVQPGWLSYWDLRGGIGMADDGDVGIWKFKSYLDYSTNPDEPAPGTAIYDTTFPARAIYIEPASCYTEATAPSLEGAQIKFKLSYDPDDWNPGTTKYKIRLKDSSGDVVRTFEGDATGDEIVARWNGKDDNNQDLSIGTYKVEAMVTSETEYARTAYSRESAGLTAWSDIGTISYLNSEKGLGWQFLNRGEPVNVSSGNYFTEAQDLFIPSRGIPISIKRYHNSQNASFHGYFGFGWSTNISPFLEVLESGNIKIMNPDGEYNLYKDAGSGNYTSMAGIYSTLKKNAGGTYTLTHKDKSKTEFNTRGQVSRLVDPNNNTLTFSYDATNKLSAITDSASRNISFQYDDVPRITKITDFANRSITYQYDDKGNLQSVTDPIGYSTWYYYNNKHQLQYMWDAQERLVLTNTYDDTTGRVTSQKMADGTTFNYSYDTTASTATMTTGSQTFKYYYDTKDNLIKEEDPLSAAIVYTYDANRNMTSVTDPLSHTTSYAYDANGNRTKITDPLGAVTTTTYDATFNKPAKITTALSQVTKFLYDTKGNLTKTTDPMHKSTLMTYDQYGQLATTTDANKNITAYAYSSTGNMTSSTNSLGKTTSFAYDAVGNMTKITDSLGNSTSKAYNSNNWLTSITDPLNNTTIFIYDPNGNLVQTEDALHRFTSYTYDTMNRLTEVMDSQLNKTNYGYDPYGNMTLMRDAKGNATQYSYDPANRLTKVTDPLNRSTSFAYDAAGNMVSRSDAKSQNTTYAYDAANRLKSKSGTASVTYIYDAVGRRTLMTDSTGTTTYTYDKANRLKKVVSPGNKTISYTYDPVGNLKKLTDSASVATVYAYDDINRLIQTKRGTKKILYGYDAANRPTNKTYPNSIQSQYSYDNANRLTGITHQSGGNPIWTCTYGYDSVGNRVTKTDSTASYKYMYDLTDRLLSVEKNGLIQTSYEYDPVGNRTKKIALPSAGGEVSYTYDAANQMLTAGSVTHSYDANGNLASKTSGTNVTSYTNDGEDRLTKIDFPGGTTNTFTYNGDGLRVSMKNKTGSVTRYVWSGSDVVNEYNSAWTVTKSYFLGASLEGQFDKKSDVPKYFHTDGLGSVMKITDSAGTVTDTHDYSEFGEQITSQGNTSNVYKYTGQQSDADSGLLYLRARYMDPETGRLLTKDPTGGNIKNPMTFHAYIYCRNNPLSFVDPLGLDVIIILSQKGRDDYESAEATGTKEKPGYVELLEKAGHTVKGYGKDRIELSDEALIKALKEGDHVILSAHGDYNKTLDFLGIHGKSAQDLAMLMMHIPDRKARDIFLDACASGNWKGMDLKLLIKALEGSSACSSMRAIGYTKPTGPNTTALKVLYDYLVNHKSFDKALYDNPPPSQMGYPGNQWKPIP